MPVCCSICCDAFLPTGSTTALNHCGHVFHHDCLLQWLTKQPNCPECRQPAHELNLHRVYLNIMDKEDSSKDLFVLQKEVVKLKSKIMSIETDLAELRSKLANICALPDKNEAFNMATKKRLNEIEDTNKKLQQALDNFQNNRFKAAEVMPFGLPYPKKVSTVVASKTDVKKRPPWRM